MEQSANAQMGQERHASRQQGSSPARYRESRPESEAKIVTPVEVPIVSEGLSIRI